MHESKSSTLSVFFVGISLRIRDPVEIEAPPGVEPGSDRGEKEGPVGFEATFHPGSNRQIEGNRSSRRTCSDAMAMAMAKTAMTRSTAIVRGRDGARKKAVKPCTNVRKTRTPIHVPGGAAKRDTVRRRHQDEERNARGT